MFNFIKKLGNRIKNIFNRPSYKKLYKEAIKQQEKTLEQVSQLKEQVSQMTEQVKSLTKLNEDNQTKIGEYQTKMDEYKSNMEEYKKSVNSYNIDHDTMGYIVPHALRNILIISATPYQWKHMIQQRTCNRNTQETQYIMLKIWEALYNENPVLFKDCGPFCMTGPCKEGKMCCGRPIDKGATPTEILKNNYPLLYK